MKRILDNLFQKWKALAPQAEARGVASPMAAANWQVGLEVAHCMNSQAASFCCELAFMPIVQCHIFGFAGRLAALGKVPYTTLLAILLFSVSVMSMTTLEVSHPMAARALMKSFRHSCLW